MALKLDDLDPGILVMVDRPIGQRIIDVEDGDPVEAIQFPTNPPPGVPLRILSVNGPFIAVSAYKFGRKQEEIGPMIIDTRRYRLIHCSQHFVDACARFRSVQVQNALAKRNAQRRSTTVGQLPEGRPLQ